MHQPTNLPAADCSDRAAPFVWGADAPAEPARSGLVAWIVWFWVGIRQEMLLLSLRNRAFAVLFDFTIIIGFFVLIFAAWVNGAGQPKRKPHAPR